MSQDHAAVTYIAGGLSRENMFCFVHGTPAGQKVQDLLLRINIPCLYVGLDPIRYDDGSMKVFYCVDEVSSKVKYENECSVSPMLHTKVQVYSSWKEHGQDT